MMTQWNDGTMGRWDEDTLLTMKLIPDPTTVFTHLYHASGSKVDTVCIAAAKQY